MVTSLVRAEWYTAAVLWVALAALSARVRTAEEQVALGPVGRLTCEEVIDRTERLWSELGPPAVTVTMVVEPMVTHDRRDRPHQVWDVECRDAAGKVMGDVLWDADTGRLSRFMRRPSPPGWCASRPVEREAAERIGWETLAALQLVDRDGSWRSARPAERDALVWTMAWQTGGEAAGAWVDAQTGEVLMAWRRLL